MNLSNKKVFEGSKYRSLIRQLNLHQRKYNNIDFNKIILSDIIPDFEPDSRKNIFLHIQNIFYSIRYLLYICIWLFLYKKVIYFKKNNNCNIWFILPPSNRDVYLNEIKKFNFYNIKPTIISWRKEFNGINIFKNIRRVFSFFVLIKKTKLKFLNLEKLIYTNFVIFKSMDLLDSFKMIDQLPKAIYSQKDYQRYENALIQICNLYSVETFTSQHSVPHVFSDKNERVGNIMVTNNVSKNFLIWGHFAKNIYRKYNPSSSFFTIKAHFRPNINNKVDNFDGANNILVTLGCSRRSEENLNLLRLLKSLKKHKDYKIIIRPHPSAKINEIKKLINDLKFKANIEISEGAKNHLFNYSSNTICITGLSGVYYDLMYLGYKVIFFDNDYTIEQKLPRALPPVKTSYSLEEQIEMLLNYDILKWKQNSNKILMECIGMKMLENKNTSLADDIDNIINN